MNRLGVAMLLVLGSWLSGVAADGPPRLAVPHTAVSPVIDGSLTDSVWGQAAVIASLRPALGGDLAEADRIPTVVRVLWHEDFLFVAFECRDDDIFVSGKMQRDNDLYKEDVAEVFLDGGGDGRQWIEIQVSPLGEVLDLMFVLAGDPEHTDALRLTDELVSRQLFSFREWNLAGLSRAVGRMEENGRVVGWTVEMGIPAAAIMSRHGRERLEPMVLRGNFLRYDHRPKPDGEGRDLIPVNWAPVQHGCPHISPGAMGFLELMPATP
jgi:hypothetical protein